MGDEDWTEAQKREAWGAFAAGVFYPMAPDVEPRLAWRTVQAACRTMRNDLPYTAEELQQFAAAWAVKNMPPDVLLRRRWF